MPHPITCAAVAALALAAAGCVGTSPPTRFYALETTAPTPLAPRPDLALGLGPVSLPDALDRPQILVRAEPYRRELAEFDRWVGDLRGNLTRVLALRLQGLLGTDRVYTHPWPRQRAVDAQVQVEVQSFEGTPGGTVELRGTWVLLDAEGRRELYLAPFALSAQAAGGDYRGLVAAMSGLAEALAEQIARGVAQRLPAAG